MNKSTAIAWLTGRPVPIDFDGPVSVAFERFASEWTRQPAIRRFHAVAGEYPDKLAIDDGTTRLTYGQVRTAVSDLAGRIGAATEPGAPVVALLENTAAFPIAFLASLMAGRPIIPVDLGYPLDRQTAILEECGAKALLIGATAPEAEKILPELPRIVLSQPGRDDAGLGSSEPEVSPLVDAPAGVIYTSGSTGTPKGVAFSQRQFLAGVAEYVNACHIGPHDRILGLASLSGASAREALAALLTGATFVIADLRQSGIGPALRRMAETQPTILAFVPSVLRGLLAVPGLAQALAGLRVLDLFGEPITREAVASLRAVLPAGCHIRASFGSTETLVLFHWFVPPDMGGEGQGLPCGYLASTMAIALLDESGAPVAPGETGEVVVRSPVIASGMWRNGTVVPGPFTRDSDDPAARVFHTGDLVRLRPDGLAEFVGRRDRRVKIHGLRADPGDLEAALHRVPGLRDCAVVARTDGEDTVFVAYVVGSRDLASARSIRDALRPALPSHMVPAEIHLIDRIPRLPNFKPDLIALARSAASGVQHGAD